jgi:hypothetical protein
MLYFIYAREQSKAREFLQNSGDMEARKCSKEVGHMPKGKV